MLSPTKFPTKRGYLTKIYTASKYRRICRDCGQKGYLESYNKFYIIKCFKCRYLYKHFCFYYMVTIPYLSIREARK